MRFDRPGVVRVFCEIHSHMNAFVLVFAHPYFAVTDAEGRYRLERVPPGEYQLSVWNDGQVRDAPAARAARGPPGRAGLLAAMRLLSSLRSRIFLASAAVDLACAALALRLVSAELEATIDRDLQAGLERSERLLLEEHRSQLETLATLGEYV